MDALCIARGKPVGRFGDGRGGYVMCIDAKRTRATIEPLAGSNKGQLF